MMDAIFLFAVVIGATVLGIFRLFEYREERKKAKAQKELLEKITRRG